MKKTFLVFFALTIAAVLSWYTLRPSVIEAPVAAPEIKKEQPETAPLPEIYIIRVASSSAAVTIEYSQDPKPVTVWKATGDEIIVNGGYFHPDYTPSGFVVAGGERVGDRMFDEERSGLVAVKDGVFSIRDLAVLPVQKNEKFDSALQSYPFLIKNGAPALTEDSGLRARRTAIGIDKYGFIYIISVPYREVSLYEFMNELIKSGIVFTDVLNLDGGPSTGLYRLWDGETFTANSFTPIPTVIRFKKQ